MQLVRHGPMFLLSQFMWKWLSHFLNPPPHTNFANILELLSDQIPNFSLNSNAVFGHHLKVLESHHFQILMIYWCVICTPSQIHLSFLDKQSINNTLHLCWYVTQLEKKNFHCHTCILFTSFVVVVFCFCFFVQENWILKRKYPKTIFNCVCSFYLFWGLCFFLNECEELLRLSNIEKII